jgi:hypothetical protein
MGALDANRLKFTWPLALTIIILVVGLFLQQLQLVAQHDRLDKATSEINALTEQVNILADSRDQQGAIIDSLQADVIADHQDLEEMDKIAGRVIMILKSWRSKEKK